MHDLITALSRWMAYAGGIVLSALIVITCISILGREASDLLHSDAVQTLAPGAANGLLALGIGPVRGDFELVEAGMAFCICAFLPYCTLTAGHASVDIFTNMLSERGARALAAATAVLFAVVLIVLCVQLFSGMQSKLQTGQTTFLLAMPVWWAYAASFVGLLVTALVGVHVAILTIAEAVTGRPHLPRDGDAIH